MKRNFWLTLIPVLVTGLCGLLSFLAGHYVPWTPLGTPPEPAVEITSANGSAVYVRAAGSKAYRCVHGPRGTYPLSRDCGWEEINLADFGPGVSEKDELCAYFLPPGRVADRFYVCSSPHWRYVVLTDGSVWGYYDDFDSMISWFHYYRYTFSFPVGTLIGFLLGITVYGLLRWRRQHATKSH